MNLKLIATEQLYDVVHVFNTEDEGYDTEQSETITKISHLSVAGVAIQDNTVVTVSGMVRFPDYRTSDVVCGLPYAVINAYKQQCGNDGSCTYEEADEYTADALGYFEISVTPGDTYLFHASYGDHSICYSEDGFDAECSTTIDHDHDSRAERRYRDHKQLRPPRSDRRIRKYRFLRHDGTHRRCRLIRRRVRNVL